MGVEISGSEGEEERDRATHGWWIAPMLGLAVLSVVMVAGWWVSIGPGSPKARAREFASRLRMGMRSPEIARAVREHRGRVTALGAGGMWVQFYDRLSPWRKRLGMYEYFLVEISLTSRTLTGTSVKLQQMRGDEGEELTIPIAR